MRAFAYCRVSTQEQACDDHYSLGNQEQRCREYIKHKSWQLVKVLQDVASGKSAERESYQELLRAIREHRVDVVVVYRLDRLSRSVVDIYNTLDLFHTHEVGFVSVQEAFDTTTAMGRAMLGVAAVFAQLTREMISENTKDGLARRVQSGKYVGGGATTPYGYRFAAGQLEIVESEAQVVGRVFAMYTERGWGVGKIAAVLNQTYGPEKPVARAENGRTISISIPAAWANRTADFVANLENLTVESDRPSRVVINERTGTIVMGKNVRVAPVAIMHGNLNVEVQTVLQVSQPAPLSTGTTQVVPLDKVAATEERAKNVILREGATVEDLVRALNAIGSTPRDIIAILESLRAAGALDCEVEVI